MNLSGRIQNKFMVNFCDTALNIVATDPRN